MISVSKNENIYYFGSKIQLQCIEKKKNAMYSDLWYSLVSPKNMYNEFLISFWV